MKNQLPLLILLSASTFGLGHELGANGPRNNPETPWSPGDRAVPTLAISSLDGWALMGIDPDKAQAANPNDDLSTDWTVIEEVGDWARMPRYGVTPPDGAERWFYFPDLVKLGKDRALREHELLRIESEMDPFIRAVDIYR